LELGLENDLIIKCDYCDLIYVIDKDSLDVNTYSYERNMGVEVEYNFVGEYCCEECGNSMEYTIKAYEYPVGALNYEDYESKGCTFVQKPSMKVDYYEFDYDYYEEEISIEVNRVNLNIFNILNNQEAIYNLSSREFEELVAELFSQQGFDVELTPETRDGGCDIIATKSINRLPFMLLIECKKYSKEYPVGVNLVRSLIGVQSDRKANKAVLVTTSRFTKPARQLAERQQHLISLVDINDLMQMIIW
jgi:hypothetical protein